MHFHIHLIWSLQQSEVGITVPILQMSDVRQQEVRGSPRAAHGLLGNSGPAVLSLHRSSSQLACCLLWLGQVCYSSMVFSVMASLGPTAGHNWTSLLLPLVLHTSLKIEQQKEKWLGLPTAPPHPHWAAGSDRKAAASSPASCSPPTSWQGSASSGVWFHPYCSAPLEIF